MEQWGYERDLQLDLPATHRRSAGQCPNLHKSAGELGHRFYQRRAAQGLVARLAPPFDCKIVEAGLGEMMRDGFWLRRRALRNVAQDFGGAAVQHLATAPEQALVGGVLDQRVLEAVVRLRANALGDKNVGFREPVQCRVQSGLAAAELAECGAAVSDRGYKTTAVPTAATEYKSP